LGFTFCLEEGAVGGRFQGADRLAGRRLGETLHSSRAVILVHREALYCGSRAENQSEEEGKQRNCSRTTTDTKEHRLNPEKPYSDISCGPTTEKLIGFILAGLGGRVKSGRCWINGLGLRRPSRSLAGQCAQ